MRTRRFVRNAGVTGSSPVSGTISYINDACAYEGLGMFFPANVFAWKYLRWWSGLSFSIFIHFDVTSGCVPMRLCASLPLLAG
jgi:hypothetical protein